jgi:hypothetical protein
MTGELSAMSPLQVDMDPVRLSVACMALSLRNQLLETRVKKLEQYTALLSEENTMLRALAKMDKKGGHGE